MPAASQTINEDLKITASDAAASDNFGCSIAFENGVVAVGSYLDDDNSGRSGSAYLFDTSTGGQLFKLLPNDGAAGDSFGWSIAIDNGEVAVGAMADDDNGANSGSAYLYSPSVHCPPDLTNDGALNFLDVSAFLSAYGAQDSAADFQPDGNFNFLDVSAYLAAFGAGCP